MLLNNRLANLGLLDILTANIIIPIIGNKKHMISVPNEAVSVLLVFFAPQLGQVEALLDISFPHSLQFIKAIKFTS